MTARPPAACGGNGAGPQLRRRSRRYCDRRRSVAQAIEAALIKLEALARANGFAIGVATAFAGQHRTCWALGAEPGKREEIALAPLSAAATARRASQS